MTERAAPTTPDMTDRGQAIEERGILLDLRRKLVSGGGWVIGGRTAGVVVGLLSNALLARLLSQSALGAYFLTITVASTTATIAGLGLSGSVVRFTSEARGLGDPGRARQAVLLSFLWGVVGAGVAAVILGAGGGAFVSRAAFHSEAMAAVMPLAAVWLFLTAMQVLQAEAFRGLHDIPSATLFGGVLATALNVVAFAFLRLRWGTVSLTGVVAAMSVVAVILVGAGSLLMRRRIGTAGAVRELRSGELLRSSMPLWLSGMTFTIVSQADLWIVGAFLSPTTVAVYGAASRFTVYLSMPLMLVNAVIPPLVGEMYARGDRRTVQHLLQATSAVAAVPALLIMVILWAFAGDLLGIVFGNAYRVGAPILVLLTLGHVVNVLTGSCGTTLVMTGHQKAVMFISLLSAVVTVGTALLLVDAWHETGVACGAVSGMVVQNVAMWWYARRSVGLDTHASFPELFKMLRAR